MIEDGYYFIRYAKNASLAADVQYASDDSTNIWAYTANGSDAQIACVVTMDKAKGYQGIWFPLCSKGAIVSGSSVEDGSNVVTWDVWHTGMAMWSIVADGKTATVDGTSRKTYTIASAADKTRVWDVEGGSTASGANIQVYTANGTDAQRWCFVPVGCLSSGWYVIRSAKNPDVAVGGKNVTPWDQPILLKGYAADETQVMRFERQSDGSAIIRPQCAPGACVDGAWQGLDGNPVTQNTPGDWSEKRHRWLAVPSGSRTVAGVTFPVFKISNQSGSDYVLDAVSGGSSIGTLLQTYESNGTDAQRWYLEATEPYSASIPAPSNVNATDGTTVYGTRVARSKAKLPSFRLRFSGSAAKWQMRFRMRTREPSQGASARNAWGPWYTPTGRSASLGWGIACADDLAVTRSGGSLVSTRSIANRVDGSTYDLCEYQVQVRGYADDVDGSPAHGAPATATIVVSYPPAITVTVATWTPEGLNVVYTSDSPRSDNSVTISAIRRADGSQLTAKAYTATGCAKAGTVTVPTTMLRGMPSDGEKLSFTAQMALAGAQAGAVQAVTVACSHDAGRGMSISPTVKVDATTRMLSIRMPKAYRTQCAYVGTWGSLTDVALDGTNEVQLPYAFGEAFSVWVMAHDGTNWDVYEKAFPAEGFAGALMSFQDGQGFGAFGIKLGRGDMPSFNPSTDPQSATVWTNGADRPVISFQPGAARKWTVKGVVAPSIAAGGGYALADLERLLAAHYCWLRTGDGTVARCAVTGCSGPERVADGIHEVSLTLEEVRR